MRSPAHLRACAIICGVVVLASVAGAENWPRFRGVNGAGVATDATLPTVWSDGDYRWKIELPGGGHAAPVIWGDRVFVVCANDESGARIVDCFDAATGKAQWQQRFDDQTHKKHRFNSFASATPAVEADRLYVTWGTPQRVNAVCFDHAGKIIWQVDLGKFNGGHGYGVSPVIVDDLLIIPGDQDRGSQVIALDKRSGEVRWKLDRATKRATYSTPVLFRASPDAAAELIFTNWELGVTSVDPRNGKVTWEVAVFGEKEERAIGSPIVWNDLVFATCGFTARPRNLVAIQPASASRTGKPEVIWRTTDQVPHIPTPIMVNDRLYLWHDDGIISCLNPRNGEVIFRSRLEGKHGTFFSSPVSDGKHIFNVSEYGNVVVIEAGTEFKQVAVNELDEVCRSSPAIAGGDLFVRTYSHLYCIRGK